MSVSCWMSPPLHLAGILCVISLQAILLFLKSKTRIEWHLIAFICFVFTLSTIGFGSNVKFIQMTFIDGRNIPGGPNAFTVQFYSHWVNMLGSTWWVRNQSAYEVILLKQLCIVVMLSRLGLQMHLLYVVNLMQSFALMLIVVFSCGVSLLFGTMYTGWALFLFSYIWVPFVGILSAPVSALIDMAWQPLLLHYLWPWPDLVQAFGQRMWWS